MHYEPTQKIDIGWKNYCRNSNYPDGIFIFEFVAGLTEVSKIGHIINLPTWLKFPLSDYQARNSWVCKRYFCV
jgi:hypothetical protein